MRGRHGGQAAQAKRRGEQWLFCNECGQVHARSHTYPARPDGERITLWRLLGLVVWCLIVGAVLIYALPVVLIGLAGTVPA